MASKKKKEVNEKPVELDTAIEDEIIEDDYTDNGSGNDTKDEVMSFSDDPVMEERFRKKLDELLEIARKNKNVIEDTEVINHFKNEKGMELNTERMTIIFEYLEKREVEILSITDDDDGNGVAIND